MTALLLSLTACTLIVDTPWSEPVEAIEVVKSSYAPYSYVHTNPPDELMLPPNLIRSTIDNPSYYDEKELEAYADALVAYHGYLERYIGSMEGSDGKSMVSVGNERCLSELRVLLVIAQPPIRPQPPTYSNVEKSTGSSLMVTYLNDLDHWIESLEEHHGKASRDYNRHLKKLRNVCK